MKPARKPENFQDSSAKKVVWEIKHLHLTFKDALELSWEEIFHLFYLLSTHRTPHIVQDKEIVDWLCTR